jgi:thiosulfate/3-mercaptopyruvate sulfurtransferase
MNPLVSCEWLNSRLGDPDLVVLDATLPPVGVSPVPDMRARYLAAHIPGALYFDIEEFSDHNTSLPHMLPSPEEFARKASALGFGSSMTIVVYEQQGVFSAPRAWWMFRTFGWMAVCRHGRRRHCPCTPDPKLGLRRSLRAASILPLSAISPPSRV